MVDKEEAGTQARGGTAIMRPRARLISLIGEELISDEPVAVVELVKNAYDADASAVKVVFEGRDPGLPDRVVIQDDGLGMDLNTVLHSWFEPGTISKKRDDRSPGGRLYQGAKGIGRFASARLGDTLLMETKREDTTDGVSVLLNWGRFDDESYLDAITLDYSVGHVAGLNHGTRLTVEGARAGVWTEESYRKLHARLSRLISPFEEIKGFEIDLQVPAYPDICGAVEPPELVLKPKYLLKGSLGADGLFDGSISVDGRRRRVFHDTRLEAKGSIPGCGPFSVEVRAWDRDREGLEPLAQSMDITLTQVRQTLNVYCGVSLYRDGFRVHPYGETGNDWQNLDLRSRQNPGRNLANNQIIAAIRISREGNPGLRDRSTREGMVRNVEHDELERWFKAILTLLEKERYEVRPKKETSVRAEALFEPFDLGGTVKEVASKLGAEHPVARLVQSAEKQVAEGVERVQETFSRLLLSAGLGHMVDIVIHEIGAPLGKINRQLLILEKDLESLLDSAGQEKANRSLVSIRGWLAQIHGLRERLDPQTPGRRGRASSFDVADEIGLTFDLYKALLDKQGIKFSVKVPQKPVKARMSRAILGQVLANLVDNAIYWVTHEHGAGQGGRIHVTLRELDHGFTILVCDDGPGVPQENQERIFEPYYSTKPNGIGLGLFIARMVVEPYGRLLYRDDCSLEGAGFEARFEKGVGI